MGVVNKRLGAGVVNGDGQNHDEEKENSTL